VKRDPDLDPLPMWRQRQARMVAWWRRSRDRRQTAYRNVRKTGARALTLAISMLGVMLVSFGVYSIYAPAGYVVGGVLLWALQWNYGQEEGDGS
jgi:hypothetical protein